ncbi:hypothetical protein HELRODRAFT_159570 [Helobdella robusta]|uniref:Uncharacterized protein n=1 Tax=Helobdella robusta TaxID=6412 RepID=T1EP65_HELRO|nr:hypothetical protein HELRODRAFT_159570 [Helobdella robusta]ESO12976.1 hypothetical protein HELRODRAFT_159570 [Helobdella robusta]
MCSSAYGVGFARGVVGLYTNATDTSNEAAVGGTNSPLTVADMSHYILPLSDNIVPWMSHLRLPPFPLVSKCNKYLDPLPPWKCDILYGRPTSVQSFNYLFPFQYHVWPPTQQTDQSPFPPIIQLAKSYPAGCGFGYAVSRVCKALLVLIDTKY